MKVRLSWLTAVAVATLVVASTGPLPPGIPARAADPRVIDGSGSGASPELFSDPLLTQAGKPRPPSAPAADRQRALQGDTLAAQALPTYRMSGLRPARTPAGFRPYTLTAPVARVDTGRHDADGVRMFLFGGRLYDHPVAQAQYGLVNVESFRLTGDQFYLERAIAQAQRLVDRRVESRGGWYFPYPFDFALHGYSDEIMRAPWFSAMAQGQALSLFVRLAEITTDAQWRTAADFAFASLLNPPSTTLPWVTHVDSSGLLWLEEYPAIPAASSDLTFNGHMFAMFGVHDYWSLTADDRAGDIYDGAATMVLATTPYFRNTAWVSSYCLAHQEVMHAGYHGVHITQLRLLHGLTADRRFAIWADRFRDDYPTGAASGSVVFAGGTHVGYLFDAQGGVVAARSLRLNSSSAAPADKRSRIKGRGIYYRITAGTLAGYWVLEQYSTRYLKGRYAELVYALPRTITFAAGSHTGYSFAPDGTITERRTATLSQPSRASADRTAWINGRLHVHVVNGIWSSLWVPVNSRVVLS